MDGHRSWTRWLLAALASLVVAGIGIAFLPNDDAATCWRAASLARESWGSAEDELARLQQRLNRMEQDLDATANDGQMRAQWELWAAARQAIGAARTDVVRSPTSARSISQDALEACWLARDNTEAVPVPGQESGRFYRPGALVVRFCEEAASLSEGAWKACQGKRMEGYQLSLAGGDSDYNFFGGGCFGF